MFEKGEKPAAGPGTVIGTNVKLIGALRDASDITVHGVVEGEVVSEKNIMIGETAQVKGPVNGTMVTIAGLVKGSVDASSRLEITSTGKVFGNVMAKDLVIKSGAIFVGKCAMAADEPKEGTVEPEEIKLAAKPNKPEYEVE